jgi:hypothetical protein
LLLVLGGMVGAAEPARLGCGNLKFPETEKLLALSYWLLAIRNALSAMQGRGRGASAAGWNGVRAFIT